LKKDEKFPPGAIHYEKDNENLWRETAFALRLMKQAINPRLSLKDCLNDWKVIRKKMSENSRGRKAFKELFFDLC
jgi:hypothetical protein